MQSKRLSVEPRFVSAWPKYVAGEVAFPLCSARLLAPSEPDTVYLSAGGWEVSNNQPLWRRYGSEQLRAVQHGIPAQTSCCLALLVASFLQRLFRAPCNWPRSGACLRSPLMTCAFWAP